MIIAVGHTKQVGKDTFVKFCIDILRPKTKSLKIVKRGFADKLYEFCYLVYSWCGFERKEFYESNPKMKEIVLEKHPFKMTPRQILIELGTNVLRNKWDENIWVNAALTTNDADILFITDLRFPTELNRVKEIGGYSLKITRDNLPEPTDIADTALNGYDFNETFNNSGTLQELHKFAEYFVNTRILNV